MALSFRAETLLRSLIHRHIEDGQPVSSRALAREAGLDVSPATVRNIMADLEEMGLIRAPHTSAGRVPTARGYRVFVDTLLKVRPLRPDTVSKIHGGIGRDHDPQQVLSKASDLLSNITRFAGVVFAPHRAHAQLRQIEFLRISQKRVLVILVTDDGRVQNRVVSVEREFEERELVEAANFFNDAYSGSSLAEVRHRLLREMEQHSSEMSRIMGTIITVARGVIAGDDAGEVVVSGENNLMTVPELGEVQKLRGLFEAFKTKQDLLELLDKSLKARGISIFIGDESGYATLNECSVVAKPYEVDGNRIGVLGVIGPTRMAYEEVIPVVDITARLVGSALSDESG